jgi:uncharacterized phiE125 gp8 family phage protein
MPLQLITAPYAEPLSLAEAKRHLRVTDTAQDALITALIAAVRQYAQTKCQCQIMAARWKLVLDAFPGPTLMGVPYGQPYSLPGHAIIMPILPVLQVVSITYLDMASVRQTLATTEYTVTTAGDPARITPQFGKVWPPTLPQIGAVEVTFDAGFAALLTANVGADTISVPGWKTLAVADTLRVSNRDKTADADGALPAPLAAYTDYYVRSVPSADVYTLAASSGGALIDISTAGTGDNFIGEIPAGLRSWMLLSLATLYENREAVSIDTRLTVAELPLEFLDGLLDPFRMPIQF